MGILTTIGRGLLLATVVAQPCNAAEAVVGQHPNGNHNDNVVSSPSAITNLRKLGGGSSDSSNHNIDNDASSPSSSNTNLRKLGTVFQISNDMDDNEEDSRDEDDGKSSRRDPNVCFTARQCNIQRLKLGLTKFYIGN